MEILLLWPLMIVIGVMIGAKKDRGLAGFFLSALFGPLGIIITLLLEPSAALKERKKLLDFSDTQTKAPPPTPRITPADLLELKKCVEAGILTQEEFEAKKRAFLRQDVVHPPSSVRYP